MDGTVTLVLILLVLVVGSFFLSRHLARKAVRDLIKAFARVQALDPDSAVTQAEVGVVPRGLFNPRMGLRDYRPAALRLLMQADIVQLTSDGRVYLSVAALKASNLRIYAEDL
jgi:hypothetical protein